MVNFFLFTGFIKKNCHTSHQLLTSKCGSLWHQTGVAKGKRKLKWHVVSWKHQRKEKDNSQAKAMTREYLDVLLTKAGIKIQVMETIACVKTGKFNFQTTLLRWGLGMHLLVSATATHSCLFQGSDKGFHQLRIWPQYHSDVTWVLHPLGFEEVWSGNLHTHVGFIAKGLSTGFKVNTYQNMRPG